MSGHAGYEALIALRMGTLGGEESRELLNHIAGCAMCQRAAQEMLDVRADSREVVASLAREDARPRRSPRVRTLALAAMLAAVAVTFVLRRPAPPPTPPPVVTTTTAAPAPPRPAPLPVRPAALEAIVRDAVAAGTIAPPALLLSLQPAGDEFRSRSEDVKIPDMQPFGEVVESDRPLFRWPKTDGATYTVLVGERGRIVTQSPSLDDNSWRCDVALPRGRTYRWQVEIRKDERTSMMPMPPAPSARFHILDAKTKAQIDEARPDDHLLLGILYARAGMRGEALEHLDNVDSARALRDSVRAWPDARR